MFKKRSSAASTAASTRRPGQALETLAGNSGRKKDSERAEDDAAQLSDSSQGSDDSSSPSSCLPRPAKRRRRTGDVDDGALPSPSAPSLEPTLVTVSSTRSALPDNSSHSHRFARFAPKTEPPPPPTAATASPTLSLSTSTVPSPSRFGPQKASGYARAISRIDFQPDICKDWMECGSCGYGDSCKFLHDRLDYKQSWQIDKEWEETQKKEALRKKEERERRERGETVEGGEGRKPQLPFACFLCRQPFTRPVVTQCGHYFDEHCALRRFATSSRCAICGKETQGSFSTATELLPTQAQGKAGEGQWRQRREEAEAEAEAQVESDSDSVR